MTIRQTIRWMMMAAAIVIAAMGVAEAQPEQVNEFVLIDELPAEDRLPAAPFLIAAYSIVWLLAFGYFWMLSRRLATVEREVTDLRRRPGIGDGDGGGAA